MNILRLSRVQYYTIKVTRTKKENTMKPRRISRTILFAISLGLLGVIEAQIGYFAQFMTKETFGLFSILVAGVVAILRVLTTTPLGGDK